MLEKKMRYKIYNKEILIIISCSSIEVKEDNMRLKILKLLLDNLILLIIY